MIINEQGLEHMKMPFIHSICNDHKYRYIFMNFIICTLIVKCISQKIKYTNYRYLTGSFTGMCFIN